MYYRLTCWRQEVCGGKDQGRQGGSLEESYRSDVMKKIQLQILLMNIYYLIVCPVFVEHLEPCFFL
jgi:hypothetical protein